MMECGLITHANDACWVDGTMRVNMIRVFDVSGALSAQAMHLIVVEPKELSRARSNCPWIVRSHTAVKVEAVPQC